MHYTYGNGSKVTTSSNVNYPHHQHHHQQQPQQHSIIRNRTQSPTMQRGRYGTTSTSSGGQMANVYGHNAPSLSYRTNAANTLYSSSSSSSSSTTAPMNRRFQSTGGGGVYRQPASNSYTHHYTHPSSSSSAAAAAAANASATMYASDLSYSRPAGIQNYKNYGGPSSSTQPISVAIKRNPVKFDAYPSSTSSYNNTVHFHFNTLLYKINLLFS